MALTPTEQLTAIEAAERASSILSVLGAFLIISTFLSDSRFRKPINRLVFYASWGNLFANVATLISREGIKQGIDRPLCQFQAFLIQWFMPADALFTFAMACNVYLTFFKQHDAASLRKLEWRYLALCYGLPFIPAVTFLCVDTAGRGKIYGPANLWCWISLKWNGLRIAAFYGPVWVIILFDMFMYIKVGVVVFRWRKSVLSTALRTTSPGADQSLEERPTYEVNVISQVPHTRTRSMISQHSLSLQGNLPFQPSHSRRVSEQRRSDHSTPVNTTVRYRPSTVRELPRAVDANRATLQYCYTACLFSFALIVTWVPSTVNRLYTLITNQPSPFALDLSSALVLPLQGFWNTVIYTVTSWAACRALWNETVTSRCCCGRNRRALPSAAGGGDGLQQLDSTDFHRPLPHAPKPSQPKDPYPLSPISSRRWTLIDRESQLLPSPPQSIQVRLPPHPPPPHRPERPTPDIFASDREDDNTNECADIVMSLDSRGRILHQGRNQFGLWATPVAAAAPSPSPPTRPAGGDSSSSPLTMTGARSSPTATTNKTATEEIFTPQRSHSVAGVRGGRGGKGSRELPLQRSISQRHYHSRDGFGVMTPPPPRRSHSAAGTTAAQGGGGGVGGGGGGGGSGGSGGMRPQRSYSQRSYRSRDGVVVPPHSRAGSGHIVEQIREDRI